MELVAFFTLAILIALYKSDRVKAKISDMRFSMGVKAQWKELNLSNHNFLIKIHSYSYYFKNSSSFLVCSIVWICFIIDI